MSDSSLSVAIQAYWDRHIHDLDVAVSPMGTADFFRELEEYRFDKLRYLRQILNVPTYRGKQVLEVGCGLGIDLSYWAQNGAQVTGIDLSSTAIELARLNLAQRGLRASLHIMDGERLAFEDNSFDMVYAHGVLQYTADARRMLDEIYRVLRPGGETILGVYNRYSWLNLLSHLAFVELEHEDAPMLRKHSVREVTELLAAFAEIRLVLERFPVKTRLHHGVKGLLYNEVFVRGFGLLPRRLVRPLGWHIIAFATK
jgi:ubiquinone/menaquinone biosynthesis C-methylase UbiE